MKPGLEDITVKEIKHRIITNMRLQRGTGDAEIYDNPHTSSGDVGSSTQYGSVVSAYEETHAFGRMRKIKQSMEKSRYYKFIRPMGMQVKKMLPDRFKYMKNIAIMELLKYDNDTFITKVYESILNRAPEQEGLNQYLALLIDGVPKEILLYCIANSEEAKTKNFNPGGLWQLKNVYRGYRIKSVFKRIPILGILISIVHNLYRAPQMIANINRNFRQLQFDLNRVTLAVDNISRENQNAAEAIQRQLQFDLNRVTLAVDNISRENQNAAEAIQRQLHSEIDNGNHRTIHILNDTRELTESVHRQLKEIEAERQLLTNIITNELTSIRETCKSLESALYKKETSLEQINKEATESLSNIRSINQVIYNELMHIKETHKPVINAPNNISVIQFEEFILALPAEEWRLVAYMNYRGQLEPGMMKLFKSLIKEGMKVVDIGANIGVYTLAAAKLIGDTGRVYSFEPTPRTFEILKSNIQVNGLLELGRIVLHNIALGDTKKNAKFSVYPNNSGWNTLFPDDQETCDIIEVEVDTIDAVLKAEGIIDIIKIDAEGAEAVIFRGMKNIIAQNKNIIIFMEFAPSNLIRAGVDLKRFINEIYSQGFSIMRINDLTGELTDINENELIDSYSINIILRKNGSENK